MKFWEVWGFECKSLWQQFAGSIQCISAVLSFPSFLSLHFSPFSFGLARHTANINLRVFSCALHFRVNRWQNQGQARLIISSPLLLLSNRFILFFQSQNYVPTQEPTLYTNQFVNFGKFIQFGTEIVDGEENKCELCQTKEGFTTSGYSYDLSSIRFPLKFCISS